MEQDIIDNPVFDYHNFGFDERKPCWYYKVKKAATREEYKLVVGCKGQGKTEEYQCLFSKLGDTADESYWTKAMGLDYAVQTIELFRSGGVSAFEQQFGVQLEKLK